MIVVDIMALFYGTALVAQALVSASLLRQVRRLERSHRELTVMVMRMDQCDSGKAAERGEGEP